MSYIVELEAGVWLAPWDGDPGRTTVEKNALRFPSMYEAKLVLAAARKYRPFESSSIAG